MKYNKKRIRWRAFGLGAAAVAVGCSASDPNVERASLTGRVHLKNAPLSLASESAGGVGKQTFGTSDGSGYTYVASVDSPINPSTGDRLQATNFAFDSKYAYVTYNMAGPKVEGALEIVDLSDKTKPKLLGSVVTTGEEYADVALVGNYAFAVGLVSDKAYEGGSLTVFEVSNPAAPTEIGFIRLGSRYGTSIEVEGSVAYVSTGSNGGVVRVDISNPTRPSVIGTVALENALSVFRSEGSTFALAAPSRASLYKVGDSNAAPLVEISGSRLEAPGRMAFANGYAMTNSGNSGLSVVRVANGGNSASVAYHAALKGTGNGIDVAGNLAVLAQGEAGTYLYDVTRPATPVSLGYFAFPDESGSANEVRFGRSQSAQYVFLSNGLTGFRIIQIGSEETPGAACGTKWWLESVPGEWWSAPSTNDSSSPGTWSPVAAETTDLCRVEEFKPNAANASCSSIGLKRAIAIGPVPNEGQKCPVRCPAGTVIANVHTRYGQASPLNAGGSYSCTGTREPESHEIDCDVMSSFCDGTRDSCTVTYHNIYCGDPWYNCIKSGRTKWQCIPEETYNQGG